MLNFDIDNIYMFFDGIERNLTPSYFGHLLSCKHYTSPFVVLEKFVFDVVWKEHTKLGSIEKKASCLKSLLLRFLHDFIPTIVQCKNGSYNKVTDEDLWMFNRVAKGGKLTLLNT